MSWMRRFANALVSFVNRELEDHVPGRAEEHHDPALENHQPIPADYHHRAADHGVPNPVEEHPVPKQNVASPAQTMPGGFPPSTPPDSQGRVRIIPISSFLLFQRFMANTNSSVRTMRRGP